MLLLVILATILVSSSDCAATVGPHSIKMHLEWNRSVQDDDWSVRLFPLNSSHYLYREYHWLLRTGERPLYVPTKTGISTYHTVN